MNDTESIQYTNFPAHLQKTIVSCRAVILNTENQILLIRRSSTESYNQDKWEIPGGKVIPGLSIVDSLKQEIFEETGITITPREFFFHEKYLDNEGYKYDGFLMITFFTVVTVDENIVTLSDEHHEHKWIDIEAAFQYDLTPTSRFALEKVQVDLKADQ